MTTTVSHKAGRRQSLPSVLRAELRRHLSSRRFHVRLGLVLASAVLAGVGALSFVSSFDPSGAAGAAGTVPTAVELAGGVAAILMGLTALAVAAAETMDGTVLSTLLLVPNRMRLFLARAVAPTLIALVVALVAALAVLAIGVAMSGAPSDPGRLMLGLLAVSVTAPLTALLGFLTGTLVRRGAAAMASAMMAVLVLPLAIGVAQVAGPSALNPALGVAMVATPGVAVMQSLSTATGAVPEALKGLGVLIAWILVIGIGARARFAHEGLEA